MAEEKDQSPEIKYSDSQKRMFNGFSTNLYGNNWFVLSTNEGGKTSAICGILEELPELEFSTTVADGPQETLTKKITDTFGVTDRSSLASTIGSAIGANLNKQLGGNYTKRVYTSKEFQSNGFELRFTAWKRPDELFDSICLPSSQKEVVNYLSKFATVHTMTSFVDLIDGNVEQAIAGLGSVAPIITQAKDEAGKIMFGSGSNKDIGPEAGGLIDTIGTFLDATATFADEVLVRGWNDRQRITNGAEKFNESLHRLDVLRNGVLDSYLIVAVENWNYQLDQKTLGEKMEFSIKCKIDQRMNSGRLKLYNENSDNKIFG